MASLKTAMSTIFVDMAVKVKDLAVIRTVLKIFSC